MDEISEQLDPLSGGTGPFPGITSAPLRRRCGATKGLQGPSYAENGIKRPMATADGPFHCPFPTELTPTFRPFPAVSTNSTPSF